MAPPSARVAMTFSVMNTIATRSRMGHPPSYVAALSTSALSGLADGHILDRRFSSVFPSSCSIGSRSFGNRLEPIREVAAECVEVAGRFQIADETSVVVDHPPARPDRTELHKKEVELRREACVGLFDSRALGCADESFVEACVGSGDLVPFRLLGAAGADE